jgi:alkaline phosphatase
MQILQRVMKNVKHRFIHPFFVLIFLSPFMFCQPAVGSGLADSVDVPKNIILLIGDGMSYPQISVTEYAHGSLRMTSMPHHGIITTYSEDNEITDSAAAATALATGYKTNNGMLGILPDGSPLQSIARRAAGMDKSTALLTTSSITHATPAAFAVHHESRHDHYIIAEKMADSGIDMFLGGGSNYFLPSSEGGTRTDERNLISEMSALGYVFIDNEQELTKLDGQKKGIVLLEPNELKPFPERGDQKMMLTKIALEQLSKNQEGFFLMIESAQIDWAGHDRDAEWMIAEMTDFDRVIGVVLDFAKECGNTLVVVTGDHETGGLTTTRGRLWNRNKVRYRFSTGRHTSLHVPVFGFGPSAELFEGSYDNTDVARKLFSIWGEKSGFIDLYE